MPGIRVSRVRSAAGLAVIRKLQLEILPSDRPYSTKLGYWWLAYDASNQVIGFAGLAPSNGWIDAMYLCRSGVIESARGKGVQRRLIAARERYAKRIGMRWLITDTHSNPASSNSLIRRGFQMYLPTNPWAGKNACYWRKDLNR